ncbi:MAG: hypothetical protein HRT43_07365 [Campylobacteraceae bacterium]|nr:hypothetical protein [Campylobacteraceae bacterium]
MIFKILAVAVVLFLVYMLFFKKNREQEIKKKKDELISDEMIECNTCGTFVSKDEAIISDAKYFCSQECVK